MSVSGWDAEPVSHGVDAKATPPPHRMPMDEIQHFAFRLPSDLISIDKKGNDVVY